MKKILYIIIVIFFLINNIYLSVFAQNITQSNNNPIDTNFGPNYDLNVDREKVLDIFVQIEASDGIWKDPNVSLFFELYELFQDIFIQLPQNKDYRIVYERCLILTDELSTSYDYITFVSFVEKCQRDLNNIIKEVNNKYTVKPIVKLSPESWPAPLTVTMDARNSTDPSMDTIPSDNFFWWYKDIDWVDKKIWQWNLVTHTFEKEWNYVIHLTARSANNKSQWVLDWYKVLNIEVTPKTANIVVYANWKKLNNSDYIKFGNKEATKWLMIDGSSTSPKWWRKIMSHWREVKNPTNFNYKSPVKDWKPSVINIKLPDNWEYSIILNVKDNEWNTLSEKFLIKVSDPIANIITTPNIWNTETDFAFDGTKSYSIQSRIKLFTWEITDWNGDKIYTTQKDKISYKFQRPGVYNIKLVITDETGQKDQEVYTLNVESSPPVAQFVYSPLSEWEFPSQFLLDASSTNDLDANNGVDNLKFERSFGNDPNVKIEKEYDLWKKVIASFDEKWSYQITLIATDSYWIKNSITKNIIIESSLRPIIVPSPKATTRWDDILFVVKANKDIINYEWDFGDWSTRIIQTNNITHKYNQAGVYVVKLRATSQNWESNLITTNVFVWEKDSPITVFSVKDQMQNIIQQKETCEDDAWKYPAYSINRYENFMIDILDSVNVKWQKNWLKWYFQPQWWEIYTKQNFNYNRTDLGCRYIEIYVEDIEANKTDYKKVWFKVFNALPVIENIKLSFPQYGNEVGIWFWQSQEQSKDNILSDPKFDPLIVKVDAQWTRDPDGSISYYTWYYYDKNNPDNILESRISPWSAPYAYFSLPKTIPGEYTFGVRMTDSDGWEIASEEVIWQSAIIPFFPDEKNLDVPLVTLVADRINIKAWDDVKFTVKSKILSQRKDFDANKTNRFDFDGDGEIDLTTKEDVVSYIFDKPYQDWVYPRVEVIYRWFKWSAQWEKITIKNWLRPLLLIETIDKTVLIRDYSIWDINKKTVCFDYKICKTNPDFIKNEWNTFSFTYPDYGQYIFEYKIEDNYGNIATERQVLELKEDKSDFVLNFKSLPQTQDIKWEPTIRVGKNLSNSVLIYAKYNGAGDCFVDTDIWYDTDGDSKSDNDRDLECNNSNKLTRYNPSFGKVLWRVYYDGTDTVDGNMSIYDFSVQFIDFETTLTPSEQTSYDKITSIIKQIDSNITWNNTLLQELFQMRNNIQDPSSISNGIIIIYDLIENDKWIKITDKTQKDLDEFLWEIANGDVLAALGSNEYFQSKQDILSLLPVILKNEVWLIFQQIEQIKDKEAEKEKIKALLNNIIKKISDSIAVSYESQWDNQILKEDFDLEIMPLICEIANFYVIETKTCWPSTEPIITTEEVIEKTSWWLNSILKRILIILGIIWVSVVWIIVYFAIKAKQEDEQTS